MKVTVSRVARHLCPYRDEVDTGRVELTFTVTEGDAPELYGLADAIEGLSNERVSHEDYTRLALDKTGAARVVTRWTTASMDVVVESP